jgi:hypothetical protein
MKQNHFFPTNNTPTSLVIIIQNTNNEMILCVPLSLQGLINYPSSPTSGGHHHHNHHHNNSNNGIWSPAITDSMAFNPQMSSPTENRTNSSSTWHSQQTYHQNYPNYYTNMEYLGSQMQQQIVIKTEMVELPIHLFIAVIYSNILSFFLKDTALESGWMKSREESNWFYNSSNWDTHKSK